MTRPIILAALLAAGGAQAVTVAPPISPAKAQPVAPGAPSNAPKRFPGVSDQGNATLAKLHLQLKEDGCRAVEALLAPRSIRNHLEAICAASSKAARAEG